MPNEAPQPYARGTWRAQPARWQGSDFAEHILD
jgi:hypothetical protein